VKIAKMKNRVSIAQWRGMFVREKVDLIAACRAVFLPPNSQTFLK